MAVYSQFLGRRVTVRYRIGDVFLPASGTFVGDSGRSIFLEQHVEQRGKRSYFRWEIPYPHIQKIEELPEVEESSQVHDKAPSNASAPPEASAHSSARAASASGAPSFLPAVNPPKTA